MKISKIALAAVLAGGLFITTAFADYNKGFKYYNKYVKKKSGIKSTQLIKILGVKSLNDLDKLFENNGKPLIEKLKAAGEEKAAKAMQKVIKKGKLKDVHDFLRGIMEGKIPAGC